MSVRKGQVVLLDVKEITQLTCQGLEKTIKKLL